MKKIILAVVLVAFSFQPLWAQQETKRDLAPKLLGIAVVVSTVYDVETTFRGFDEGLTEANPVDRLFARNRASMYVFQGSVDVGVWYLSHRFRNSSKPYIRRLWWILPIAVTAGHSIAAISNMSLEQKQGR